MTAKQTELHLSTSYSYKDLTSIISPKNIIDYATHNNLTNLCIIDYCSCSSIPLIEELKTKAPNPNLKIGYGLSLNIKYDDLYIPTIILAKNNHGLKNLYQIVTKLNEDKCYFITKKDFLPLREDLVLGISQLDLLKEYNSEVLKYYSYVEITPDTPKKEALKINEFCTQNNLLLCATCKPTISSSKEEKYLTSLNHLNNYELSLKPTYLLDTATLLATFKYLPNYQDIVINNPNLIMAQISNYNLDFNQSYMYEISDSTYLKKECYERASLLYLDDIPKNVQKRLDTELALISKNNLEGTIYLLEKLIKYAESLHAYTYVGSYFAHSLIAYLLGLTPINPLDLKDTTSILNDYEKYGYHFEIFVPDKIISNLKNYLQKLLHQDTLYYKSALSSFRTQDITKYCEENAFTKEDCLNFENIAQELKVGLSRLPDTYYLIPENTPLADISPLNINAYDSSLKTIDFSYALNKMFVTLRFRPTSDVSLLYDLEKSTNVSCADIPLDDIKVLKNCYEKVMDNSVSAYPSYHHYFLFNNYAPKLLIEFKENTPEPQTLIDLINLNNAQDANWLSKVLRYYYNSYYRTYYPQKYYELYLDFLITNFSLYDYCYPKFLDQFIANSHSLASLTQKEEGYRALTLTIMKSILDLGYIDILKNLSNHVVNNPTTLKELKSSILSHKITIINNNHKSSTSLILTLINLFALKDNYKMYCDFLTKLNSDYYNRKLISLLSDLDFSVITKYFYPYTEYGKTIAKISPAKISKAINQIKTSPIYFRSNNPFDDVDYADYLFSDTFEANLILIDNLKTFLEKTKYSLEEIISLIKSTSPNTHIIIINKSDYIIPKSLAKESFIINSHFANLTPRKLSFTFPNNSEITLNLTPNNEII